MGRAARESEPEQRGDTPHRPRRIVPRVLFGLALLLAFGGVATARVVLSGEAEIKRSTAALEAGDAREAIVAARDAARWYAPGAPHVRVAYDRLIALARAAEEHRDDDLALFAWRAVRRAAIETSTVLSPFGDELAQADQEIARLMAKSPARAEPDPRVVQAELERLKKNQPARSLWAVLLCAGFATAAAGLFVWARQVGAAAGRLRFGAARAGMALTGLGVALWLVSVWRA
jgi:hypothetical protein